MNSKETKFLMFDCVVLGLKMYQKKVHKKKPWGTYFFGDFSNAASARVAQNYEIAIS